MTLVRKNILNLILFAVFLLVLGGMAGYYVGDWNTSEAIREKENQIDSLKEEAANLAKSNVRLTKELKRTH